MSVFALAFVAFASLISLVVPWIGVLAYYIFSVMQLPELWPNNFGTVRVQLILVGATALGLIGASVQKNVDWKRLFTPYSLLMILLVLIVNVSAKYSSFEDFNLELTFGGSLSQEEFLSVFNKTLIFYFMASLLIDTRQKLEISIYVLAGMLVYYAYWANKAYFTGEYWLFGDNGRLGGPPAGNYKDENYLGMLFVLASPVLYYIGVSRKSPVLRYAIWMLIPVTWHALFLTSSRGGLLALLVVTLYIFFRSFNRKASIGLAVGLVLAIIFQSGQLLNRVDETIEASERLEISSDKAINPRLISWKVSTDMMRDYPLLGVGAGNYLKAYPGYTHTAPSVAHNTYFQFSTNSGIFAGLIYLWLFLRRIPTIKRSANSNGTKNYPMGFSRDYLDDLINSLLLAFFVIAFFLDLMVYELFYFIMLMSFCKYVLDRPSRTKAIHKIESIYISKKSA